MSGRNGCGLLRFPGSGSDRRHLTLFFGRLVGGVRGGRNLLFEFLFVRQTGQLIDEHHRLVRRDLEFLAAGLAGNLVVQPQQIVAQFCELRAIDVISPWRKSIFLRPPDPPDAVVAGPAALGTGISALPGFCLIGEESAFVESHA